MLEKPILSLALPILVLLCAATAWAHSPPPIYLEFEIGDEEIVLKALLEPGPYAAWTRVEVKDLTDLSDERRERIRTSAEEFFGRNLEVRIDGVVVKATFRETRRLEFLVHDLPDEYGQLVLTYGVKGKPRQVSLRWLGFEGIISWLMRIEGEIRGYGDESYIALIGEEPEHVWHAPRGPRIPPSVESPEPFRPPTVAVPLVSAALLLAVLVFLPASFRLKISPKRRWIGAAVGLALVAGLSGVARTDVRAPWGPAVSLPDEEGATYVFETLHKNIYRAFDYDSEDDIYDTLARSVSGELLEEVYAEVFESLILRDEGGAVCRIQDVDVTESEVILPEDEDALRFRVRARWRVRGTVRHYGHVHVRVNEYRAEYTVGHDGEGYKIVAVEILEQERLE
jgi:hypothetical protein